MNRSKAMKIIEEDKTLLFQKVSQLTPVQYHHLEDIIDSFIAVAIPAEDNGSSGSTRI